MLSSLPPLNAVRAFAAAAHHASFTRAAQELGVTHSAVSRQIKHLENHLAVSLFERRVRQVILTQAGRDLLAEVAPALDRIARAATAAARHAMPRLIRVSARPSFALRWLIPHLPSFLRQHPGYEPRIVTSTADPAGIVGEYDVAIRRGRAGWPRDVLIRPFLEESAVAVIAPALLAATPLRTPADLAQHTLIHCTSRSGDWDAWLAAAGLPELRPKATLRFEHLQFSLQAALDGLGVALGPAALLTHDLAEGRLVAPLAEPSLKRAPYCLAVAPDAGPAAEIFAAWLEREGAA